MKPNASEDEEVLDARPLVGVNGDVVSLKRPSVVLSARAIGGNVKLKHLIFQTKHRGLAAIRNPGGLSRSFACSLGFFPNCLRGASAVNAGAPGHQHAVRASRWLQMSCLRRGSWTLSRDWASGSPGAEIEPLSQSIRSHR